MFLKIYQTEEVEEVKVVQKTEEDITKEYLTAAKRLDDAKLVVLDFVKYRLSCILLFLFKYELFSSCAIELVLLLICWCLGRGLDTSYKLNQSELSSHFLFEIVTLEKVKLTI